MWFNSKAKVLSAKAEKNALTAPILEISKSEKKLQLIELEVSNKTTIASTGFSILIYSISSLFFPYFSNYGFSTIFIKLFSYK